MDSLIVVINKIQDTLASAKITTFELPQIIVVGEQSSGKSSVLESIVKMDFLPRGNNIVTRRPLILQLHKILDNKKEQRKKSSQKKNEIRLETERPWGEFLHQKGKKYFNFEKIRQEIQDETDRIAKGKEISSKPIRLSIYSRDTVNLTLVDLPGLTNNPIGNQKKDLPERIYKMVTQFASNPRALILCVIPANIDIANSRAYKLAKTIDPESERTLAILTKIDLMDEGTDVRDIINGKVLPLRYGYVPVVNRSQKQVDNNITVKKAIKLEKKYFQNHPSYQGISDRCGTKYLSKTLSKLFIKRIEKFLPEVRRKVTANKIKWEEQLKIFGQSKIDGNKNTLLMTLIFNYSKKFSALIDGVDLYEDEHLKFLQGGSRINHIFYEIFTNFIKDIDPLQGLTEKELILLMKNSKGTKKTLFIPDKTFEILVKNKIENFRVPCQNCVKIVFRELESIITTKIKIEKLNRFLVLKEKIIQKSQNYLNSLLEPCIMFVNQIVDSESAFINLNHPDFEKPTDHIIRISRNDGNSNSNSNNNNNNSINNSNNTNINTNQQIYSHRNIKKISPIKFIDMLNDYPSNRNQQGNIKNTLTMPKNIKDFSIEKYEKQEIKLLQNLLMNYMKIVKIKLIDTIPKIIMFFLVNKLKDNLQNILIEKIYQPKKIDILLSESPEIERERKNCERKVHAYQKAEKILSQDFTQILNIIEN
ncbi:vacuolar protein sorting-associated protein [Anaeramoeba flamelloides]|uniref:Vacuolar protein sorting-associated protein n=1 Tax=Anaeramoeba flamelloides TaxID=1746091 RepID=A0ABQ8XHH2_9EUKA|nr:vacuolar protein sorting-associated protein [Anaeramoeba flamelloides]